MTMRVHFDATTITCDPWLPPNTIVVSSDIMEQIKRQMRPETIDGEVVREAQKQLEWQGEACALCGESERAHSFGSGIINCERFQAPTKELGNGG